MSKQVTLSVGDALKKLQKSLEDVVPSMQDEVNQAVKDIAQAAYASIVAKAQAQLGRNTQDYMKGLKFEELGDHGYLITLEGKFANELEDGKGPFDLKPYMLASKKRVEIGSRAGQPWVQKSKPRGKNKSTHKFAHVPIQHHPHSKTSNMADAVKGLTAPNLAGVEQKITQIFRDGEGKAIEGKVATARSGNPKLDNLVKYQKVKTNEAGKEIVQSIYITYRTVSEKGKSWMHPGFDPLNAFADAEAEIVKQLDQIVKVLIK